MQRSEFWILVEAEFGPGQGRALARDHVLGDLGHRTAEQALLAGEDPRTVWAALCEDLQVPPERRWGSAEASVRPTRGRAGRSRR